MTDGAPRRAVAVLGIGLFGVGLAVGGFGVYVNRLIAGGVAPGVAGLGSSLFLLGQLAVVNYAARLILGFGLGTTFLTAMKYAGRRTTTGDTARLQGVLGATFTLGLAVGIPVMPPAVEVFGPVAPSVAAAVPVAAGALFAPSLTPVQSNGHRPFGAYVDAFGNPTSLALGLANAASYGLLIVATTWYTDVLAGIPTMPVALVLAGFAAATFVGRTGSGWLTAVTTERGAVGGSLLFLAGALALVAGALWAGSVPFLAVGLVLTGASFGLPFGPLNSLAFANLGNGAALVYPWLVGWLLSMTQGYVVGFVVMALSVLAVAALWRWVMSPTPHR
ncbi:MAG: MFS transporter [Haloarculaceae archaeon]